MDNSAPLGVTTKPAGRNTATAACKHAQRVFIRLVPVGVAVCVLGVVVGAEDAGGLAEPRGAAVPWTAFLPASVLFAVCCFLALSAFFSSAETALFSIQRHRLRVLRTERRLTSRLLAHLFERPGQLLTTILVGNMLVNTLIAVLLGKRVENLLEHALDMPKAAAYVLAVISCTAVLVFFGEITPKIFAVHAGEMYARVAVVPLVLVHRVLAPICRGLLRITESLFAVTRFNELHAAPYITDEELKSLVSTTEADDVAEKEGRQMIRRILEFQDVMLREILVPRPDMVALPDTATVAQARDRFREEEYSRMPVFKDDLDHIVGILFVKDLLSSLVRGDLDRPVSELVRKAHFVPETLGVQGFVKDVQRLRSHLAIVVDEYGGTEGIVTLEDAIAVVVGTLPEEDETEVPEHACIAQGVYRLDGAMPLDEVGELTGVSIEDEEHESLSGFLMNLSGKILEVGDLVEHAGVRFTVEAVDGRRAATVRMEIPREQAAQETDS